MAAEEAGVGREAGTRALTVTQRRPGRFLRVRKQEWQLGTVASDPSEMTGTWSRSPLRKMFLPQKKQVANNLCRRFGLWGWTWNSILPGAIGLVRLKCASVFLLPSLYLEASVSCVEVQ